jgi:hypothetical protein
MSVVRIEVMVRVAVTRPVGMGVFMLVEDNLKFATEDVGYAAEGSKIGDVHAAFETRNHRFRHAQALGELHLRLTGMGSKFE